jgi:type IV pilus assembly protein PilA
MIKLRQRLSNQEGFTLIELLIVIVIIGILLAIAVPSYLGFKDRANKRAAQSDLREAIPVAEAYYSDKGTYSLMTKTLMLGIDTGMAQAVLVKSAGVTGGVAFYCLAATVGNQAWSVHGPGGVWHKNAICSGSAVSVNA